MQARPPRLTKRLLEVTRADQCPPSPDACAKRRRAGDTDEGLTSTETAATVLLRQNKACSADGLSDSDAGPSPQRRHSDSPGYSSYWSRSPSPASRRSPVDDAPPPDRSLWCRDHPVVLSEVTQSERDLMVRLCLARRLERTYYEGVMTLWARIKADYATRIAAGGDTERTKLMAVLLCLCIKWVGPADVTFRCATLEMLRRDGWVGASNEVWYQLELEMCQKLDWSFFHFKPAYEPHVDPPPQQRRRRSSAGR
ncbi:hypothetical protein JKP88DRAFT_273006 [Tribonema minus]|uniref:Uncharacterized protein n=1 Tax=Tribonema minus TaxID=303371 RepID=A0A835YZU9_9STRA|nr:hypothetical protein JKP88DRAFT_273006 [Tribonema minus]